MKIGLIGLGNMGYNLGQNLMNNGNEVFAYDVNAEFVKRIGEKGAQEVYSLKELALSLESPRVIWLMVPHTVVDDLIEELVPLLNKGDVLIDGGNTFYEHTVQRNKNLENRGIHFIGTGVSGGEEGALKGPSLMPGGQKEAYEIVRPIFESIAAKVDNIPCTTYIGSDGAGHYVKMVHNGIEYGDMQLICEAYYILKYVGGLSPEELHEVFTEWNKGELDSYLIEITANIFTKVDDKTGKPLIDVILDTAGQKGTGKWTSVNALELGVPLPIITESVFARFISAMKEERVKASRILNGPDIPDFTGNKEDLIESVRQALYLSKVCSYAQGFAQMRAASEEYQWELEYGKIAMIFRGGCIIRAQFLQKIKDAYDLDPQLSNLLLDPHFKEITDRYQSALREVLSMAIKNGIPVPALSSALAYFDSYRSERLPANLLQAQRDYFGGHTYQRIDEEGSFHTNWLDN
ncbi:NADP-dependent phosphogluconate dehydrogenase [Halobacillus salinarum]|uniref:6-phosphogluconate dehydrogenase, decarboxylating n=1 Tax=Halobacillus salinarum TaxID=2932257 RepID=A0ABY4EHP2_9BACI|nr:NADP-dependent phosphogluconate dehydrogenase [Halobacillus salinarum]UOQ43986.1 NADP-dependent phosphogluconate dehydrogenase [Halobacillus salinarum]